MPRKQVKELSMDSQEQGYAETDPTGRYGRLEEILGKGAMKTVYKAIDEVLGIEVAWSQIRLNDVLRSADDLQRLYSEIHLLSTLTHQSIIRFYTSWVDVDHHTFNFITEMFTSGTLREYRRSYVRIDIRAIKSWARQILQGLVYLHEHDPPVIHRDLKCDNIFVNGHLGQVKIGDLGLARILNGCQSARSVIGTPEFMAPEVYEEAYNELVDIYSFGMCILEMVTFEYPYSECNHPVQIYKKVVSGIKPDALYTVKDPEVRGFIEKCLATVSLRLSALELLNDPFLRVDDDGMDLRLLEYGSDIDHMAPLIRQPYLDYYQQIRHLYGHGYLNGYYGCDSQSELAYYPSEMETNGIELFEYHEEKDAEHSPDVDISIKGKRKEDGSLFLRLRMVDKEGRVRNIYFPFDIETDTALSVATEMVGELDMNNHDVTRIADMIDGEISSLVPGWESGPGIEETPRFTNSNVCYNCASTRTSMGSLMEFLNNNPGSNVIQCCSKGCASTHGRFEEITFQVEEPRELLRPKEIWGRQESRELSSFGSAQNQSEEEYEKLENMFTYDAGNTIQRLTGSGSFSMPPSIFCDLSEKNEKECQQELRWLKAKYQIEHREEKCREEMRDVEKLYNGRSLPRGLCRTTSLPVDAVDVQ